MRLQPRAHLARRQARAAPADEQRRLAGARQRARAAPAMRAAPRSAGAPTGTLRRLLPLPSTCALASARVDPAGGRAAGARRRAPTSSPTRRPQPYSSSTMQWSRAASAGVAAPSSRCSASATAWSTDSAFGSGLARLRRAHAVDRVGGDHALAGPASGRSRARPTASSAMLRGAEPVRVQLRRPAAHVVRLHLAQRARRPSAAKRCSAVERVARTAPACARPGGARPRRCCEVALDRRRRSVAGACVDRRAQRAGSRRDSAGARHLADAHQELGAHVGGVARRVGRAEHQQAEGAGASPSWRSGIIAIDIAVRRLVEPAAPPRSRS